ncbi:MAG: hypothetical protein QOJ16_684 [Acidobacteriota bacterium]|nr:hypothetical protein [Acidobacteriota bacterium]
MNIWNTYPVTITLTTLSALIEIICHLTLGEQNPYPLTITLLLAAIGLIVDGQVHAGVDLSEVKKHLAESIHTLDDRVKNLATTLEIVNVCDQIHDLQGKLRELLVNTQRAEEKCRQWDAIRIQRLRVIEEANHYLQRISAGQFETYFWSCNVLTNAVSQMPPQGEGLLGLSPWSSTDKDWWRTKDGRDFLEANTLARKKGCKVRRIFASKPAKDSKTGKNSDLAQTLRHHHELGFEVRLLLTEENLEAMAVVDDWLSFHGIYEPTRRCYLNRFSTERLDAHLLRDKLDSLWEQAGAPQHMEGLQRLLNGTNGNTDATAAP